MVKKVLGVELIKNEEVIDIVRQTMLYYLFNYLLALILIGGASYLYYNNFLGIEFELIIALGVIGLLILIITLIINKSNVTITTTERVIYMTGIFNIKTIDVDIDKIQNTKVQHNIIERMFGIGTLNLDTSGSSGFEAVMPGIPQINKRRAIIKQVMEGRIETIGSEKKKKKMKKAINSLEKDSQVEKYRKKTYSQVRERLLRKEKK
jgi:uncharacterized membrane protein YdbT with pleckstrin-like domain